MRHPLDYTPEEVLVSTLTVGGSGSGKTLSTAPKIIWAAINRACAAYVFDKHGHLVREVAKHAPLEGYKRRLYIDELRHFQRVFPGICLGQSDDPDPWRRIAQNQVIVWGCMDLLWAAAGRGDDLDAKDIHNMPALSMAADMSIRVLLFQPYRLPFSDLSKLMMMGPNAWEMVEHCQDEEAKLWWKDVLRMNREKKDRLVEERVGAMLRLWRQVNFPALTVRCGVRDVWEEVILEKKLVLVDGGNDGSVHQRAATAVCRGMNLSLFQALMRLYVKTGRENLCLHVLEEAAATDAIGPAETDFFREGRKTGWRPYVLTQDKGSFSRETWGVVKGCTQRHEWYNPFDEELAQEAGPDLAYSGNLNPDEVAYVEQSKRQLHAGFTYERRRSRSTSKDAHDWRERVTEGESEVAVPVYQDHVEERKHLRSLDDQIKLTVQNLLTQRPGERMVRHGTVASKNSERVLLLKDPYPEVDFPGLINKKHRKLVAESQESPLFITPEPPCNQSQPKPRKTVMKRSSK